MSIRVATDQSFNGPLGHRWFPASSVCDAFGMIEFGPHNYLYLHTTDEIDELIAELAALRAEMTGEARCQKPGEHGPFLAGAVVDCDDPAHHESAPKLTAVTA